MSSLVALTTGCAAGRPADPPIVTLDGEVVRRSEFEAHLRRMETRGGAPVEPAVRAALVDPFIEERLLVLEARRRGLIDAGASESDEQAAVKTLLEREVLEAVTVGEDEVAAHYQAHADEFVQPERRSLRQILLSSENEARDIRRRLEREPRSFELLARSRSRGPEAGQGGLMGTFAAGELPQELNAAAFALPVGGVSQVIRTALGYHVLRVESLDPARRRALEECQAEIRQRLLQRRSDESVRQFVRALRARAKVNHDAAIAQPS